MESSKKSKRFFCLHGPFKGSYSLAVVNRHFALALLAVGKPIRIYANERDITEDPDFLAAGELSRHLTTEGGVSPGQVFSANDWPVREPPAGTTGLTHCFGWEESIIPFELARRFSKYRLVTTTADFVTRAFANSGVTCPVVTVGNGTDHIPTPAAGRPLRATDADRPFTFLHISSCFQRKGIGDLLDAYFSEFSGADNVRLVIKTFDNPHNTRLRENLARHKAEHPNPPRTELIFASLADADYYRLYVDADCLVAPSYGEGFLLPAAEAILNDVPVITTGWGGQTDFCSPETAWLIDFRLAPSESHVAAPGALWARPDIAHLRALMRGMLVLPEEPRAAKIANGQHLLRSRFRWADAVQRYLDALAALEGGTAPRARAAGLAGTKERHLVVSTFRQKCGIATFTEELLQAAGQAYDLLGVVTEDIERPAPGLDDEPGRLPIYPIWRRHSSSVPPTVDLINGLAADHVLIEHHPGIFGWDMLGGLVAGIASRARVSLELHSVEDGYEGLRSAAGDLQQAHRVITHSPTDYRLAAAVFGGAKTSLIPHGVGEPGRGAEADGGKAVGQPLQLASFGFTAPHKGFHKVISILPTLLQAGLDVRYRIFSALDPANRNAVLYLKYCHEFAKSLGVLDRIGVDYRFLPAEQLLEQLSRCDIGIMAYDDVPEGASGACRLILRARVPIIVSSSQIFADVAGVCARFSDSPLSLTRLVLRLAGDPRSRQEQLELQDRFLEATSWRRVADMIFGMSHVF